MELAIALASILSGAAVAIAVPFINARLERSRLHAQARAAQTDELRGQVDQAMRNLYDAWTILYEVEQELARDVSHWSLGRWRDWSERLTRQVDVLVHDGLRIGLRVPDPSGLHRAHGDAQSSFLAYEVALRTALDALDSSAGPPKPPQHEAMLAIEAFVAAARAHLGVSAPASPASVR